VLGRVGWGTCDKRSETHACRGGGERELKGEGRGEGKEAGRRLREGGRGRVGDGGGEKENKIGKGGGGRVRWEL